MLANYRHFPIWYLKVQRSANVEHRPTRNNPQRDSFRNAQKGNDLDRYKTAVSRLRTKSNEELGGNLTEHIYRRLALVDQVEHGVPNTQFNPSLSGAFSRFARVAHSTSSFVHFESLASSPIRAKWLAELLNELKEIPEYAQEDDMAEPSDIALAKAKQLLEEVSKCVLDRPEIYPMHERRIAIDFRIPERKSGVLFVIEQDGAGVLFHRTENTRGRLRVDDAADLLNEGGIKELKRVGIE